jgi:imidazole glycerol-phosphate synthase subunit HisH
MKSSNKRVAIVDFGLGNIYSVVQACKHVGLDVIVSSDRDILASADALILLGVGAFGEAMTELKNRGLVEFLQDQAFSGKYIMGICLGMQLLMSESKEFGLFKGLGIVSGTTSKFVNNINNPVKIPQIGWNQITPLHCADWDDTLLKGLRNNEYMYFVHSYYVEPVESNIIIAQTSYGDINYCSAFQINNVYGFQFHPERSGPCGLKIYNNLKKALG